MAKRWIGTLLCVSMLFLSGCTPELHERLLVRGVGIDITSAGGYRVAVCTETEKDGETIIYGEGKTVPEALENAVISTGKLPLFAHTEWVLFGKDCVVFGLESCVDFFIRHYDSKPNVRLLVAEGKAEDVLRTDSDDASIAEVIAGFENIQRTFSAVVNTDLINLINASGGVLLPLVKMEDEPKVDGAVLLENMQYAAEISGEGVLGYLLLTENINSGETVVYGKELGAVSLTAGDAFCEIRFTGTKENPRFGIKARIEGEISAMKAGLRPIGTAAFEELEGLYAQQMADNIHTYLSEAIYLFGCDTVGLMRAVRSDAPTVWEELRGSESDFLKKAVFDITVEGRIDRVEEEDKPYY